MNKESVSLFQVIVYDHPYNPLSHSTIINGKQAYEELVACVVEFFDDVAVEKSEEEIEEIVNELYKDGYSKVDEQWCLEYNIVHYEGDERNANYKRILASKKKDNKKI